LLQILTYVLVAGSQANKLKLRNLRIQKRSLALLDRGGGGFGK